MITRQLFENYVQTLPILATIFFAAFFLTPLVGYIAKRFGFIDLPATKRKRTDKTIAQRIHKITKPRLGGVAYLIPLIIFIGYSGFANQDLKLIGLTIGVLILTVFGALDDKYEISAKYQLMSQIVSALIIVVLGGITISYIDIAGFNINFDLWNYSFTLFDTVLKITFPADLITIIWILTIINAMNWMYGIDAIGEAVTIMSAITTGLLCMKAGLTDYAIVSFSLAAGILGFLPFNFHPSKIIGGTAGATASGFMLAVLSIMSGAKLTNAMILLLFPLLDMVWVVVYRLYTHTDYPFLKRPFISGKVHFHHRLMMLGFTQKQILLIEMLIVSLIAILGVYAGGFSNTFIFLVVAVSLLLVIFFIVSSLAKKKEKLLIEELKKKADSEEPKTVEKRDDDDDVPPEQRYAY